MLSCYGLTGFHTGCYRVPSERVTMKTPFRPFKGFSKGCQRVHCISLSLKHHKGSLEGVYKAIRIVVGLLLQGLLRVVLREGFLYSFVAGP